MRKTEQWILEALRDGTEPECWFWNDDYEKRIKGKLVDYTPADSISLDKKPFNRDGYEWYKHAEPYKEPEHIFNPLEPVLCRNSDAEKWRVDIFRYKDDDSGWPFVCMTGQYMYCIPYVGNEKLVNIHKVPGEETNCIGE